MLLIWPVPLTARPPGVHGPIGMVLTRDGEARTWGLVLSGPPTLTGRVQALAARLVDNFHLTIRSGGPDPVSAENRGTFAVLNRMPTSTGETLRLL
jgi:hypothetical protein